jgi:glycosyltransferase involved in cell wall biosynthesis
VSGSAAPALVALSSYSRQAGSTRVRLYDWFDHLGLSVRSQTYAGLPNARPGTMLRNLPAVVAAERELHHLDVSGQRVVLSRSASPLSRGTVESRLLREAAHSAYDVDDAVYLSLSWRDRLSAAPAKFAVCVRAADVVIAGNDTLAEEAGRYREEIVVIPSCVEPRDYRPKTSWALADRPRIVWLGSGSTEAYLLDVLPALDRLERRYGIEFRVISTGRPNPRFGDRPWLRYVPWREDTVAAELQHADVAIAPLPDTPFARGKCAYKLLQYAATGLPMVGSPVGANRLALDRFDGSSVTGDWDAPLAALLDAPEATRADLGRRGIDMVARHYSFDAWTPAWRAAVGLEPSTRD